MPHRFRGMARGDDAHPYPRGGGIRARSGAAWRRPCPARKKKGAGPARVRPLSRGENRETQGGGRMKRQAEGRRLDLRAITLPYEGPGRNVGVLRVSAASQPGAVPPQA